MFLNENQYKNQWNYSKMNKKIVEIIEVKLYNTVEKVLHNILILYSVNQNITFVSKL